jgi:hypothetical protein
MRARIRPGGRAQFRQHLSISPQRGPLGPFGVSGDLS